MALLYVETQMVGSSEDQQLRIFLSSMAISSVLPTTTPTRLSSGHRNQSHQPPPWKHEFEVEDEEKRRMRRRKKRKQQQQQLRATPALPPLKPPSSWEQLKNLVTCKSVIPSQVLNPSGKLGSSCSSICAIKDVVRTNTRVVHRGDHDSHSPVRSARHGSESRLLCSSSSASRSTGGRNQQSSRGLQLRKLSGCYECHAISEPTRYLTVRTICRCPECGEVFTKSESLEHHQMVRHAVSELSPEDSGRNIVEIIFKSSWSKKEITIDYHQSNISRPIFCKIDRILKVHNTQRTISRFENYRDAVKSRAALHLLHNAANTDSITKKKNPRCAADGNELLRFHCTTLSCPLGADGSTSLCGAYSSTPPCGVCSIIRYGFSRAKHESGKGVRTTASSGRAHECFSPVVPERVVEEGGRRRAMLVCRVIAGRVRRVGDATEGMEDGVGFGYDSTAGGGHQWAGGGGKGGNLEDLFLTNPKAILPCFVVVYRMLE